MIDVSTIQFAYSKEEVDAYLKHNNATIEELLQLLIEAVFLFSNRLLRRSSQRRGFLYLSFV